MDKIRIYRKYRNESGEVTERERMLVVYIAGKFSGRTQWEVVKNVRAAEEAALAVWTCGAVALCPHSMGINFVGEGSSRLFYDGTLELLRRCDCALFLPGWQDSSGASIEFEEAKRLGMPLGYYLRNPEILWKWLVSVGDEVRG